MLTKERYITSLESIADYAYSANIGPNGIDVIGRDFNELKELIEEHFTPQPLKFEELHENMWVYDVKNKCCIYIEEFTVDNQMMIIRYPMSNRDSNCEWCNFEENRFYPIIIPIIGDNNEKHI